MAYFNYSVSTKQGKFYLKSSEPKEGFVEVTYGEGKKTYHQYIDSVKGIVKSFDTKEVDYQGKKLRFLEVVLVDGADEHKISVSLKNTKGGYTDEARTLISAFKGLDKVGEPITVTPKKSTYKNNRGEEKENLNIYVNYINILGENGKGLSTGFINFKDIPSPIKKEVAGDVVYDWTPQTEFFYEEFLNIKGKFGNAPVTPNNAPTASDFDMPNKGSEDDTESLPF